MDEPQVVWCGGADADQDVSIRLVPSGIRGGINQEHTRPRNRQTLAVVKVHSSHLRDCSKYFAMYLSKRWGKLNRNRASLEIVVEVHGEVAIYTNCFSRMYNRFLKQTFQDVEHSLKLLQVAVQIEYDDLMSSICGYLSSTMWTDEDEKTIRLFVGSPLFPHSHAKDLVARLKMAGSKDGRRLQIFHLIKQWIHSPHDEEENSSALAFFRGLLKDIREEEQSISSTFKNEVVVFINNEAKRILVEVHEEYAGNGKSIHKVPDFVQKLTAVHRVLETLVLEKMGEEGVKCFLGLDSYPKILASAAACVFKPDIEVVANEFAGLFLIMYKEVVVGNLVLGISDRVALLKNGHFLFEILDMAEKYKEAAEPLFCTLPFKQQMELLRNDEDNSESYITPSSLAKLLSNQWSAEDQEVMQGGWIE